MSKTLVCRCEDVLLSDIDAAIEAGNEDIESLKRYTGFGTGVCQGKSCVLLVARRMHEQGIDPKTIAPFTPRPPVMPIPMRLLAGELDQTTPDYPLAEETLEEEGDT